LWASGNRSYARRSLKLALFGHRGRINEQTRPLVTIASAWLVGAANGVWLVVLFQPSGVTVPSRSTKRFALIAVLLDFLLKTLKPCRR
jgi:hypothetical protein